MGLELKTKVKNAWAFLADSGGSLVQKAARGGFWVFFLKAVSGALGFARTIFIARLLSPGDFGLMGITVLAMSTLEVFSQTGFAKALIQKNGRIDSYLDSAWFVQVVRGLFLALALFLTAPLIGRFYGNTQVILLVRVVSLAPLLKGFTNIGVIYFQRDLRFKERFIYQLSGFLADFSATVLLALVLRSVWALLLGLLAGSLVKLIVSYKVSAFRPRFRFDYKKSGRLFSFGKYVFAQGIVIFAISQGDNAFVGKVVGIAALGFYQMAYTISNLPATEITYAISEVAFPVYSKLQNEKDRLAKALSGVLRLTVFITLPLSLGVFVLAPEFTRIFLGPAWMPIVPSLRVLCALGFIQSLGATFSPAYYALTKVGTILKINLIQLAFLAVVIYPLSVRWGIFGTAIGVTLSGGIHLYLACRQIMEILEIKRKVLFKPLSFFTAPSLAMALLVWFFKTYILFPTGYFSILALILLGMFWYLIFVYVTFKIFKQNLPFFSKGSVSISVV